MKPQKNKNPKRRLWLYAAGCVFLLAVLIWGASRQTAREPGKPDFYASQIGFFAASPTSAPLKEPVFLTGESIFVKTVIEFADKNASDLRQSLAIFDAEGNLLAAKKNVAQFNAEKVSDQNEILFTNKIDALPAGHYTIVLDFLNVKSPARQTYEREIQVLPAQNIPFVTKVEYFGDVERVQKLATMFAAGQKIYVNMHLGGIKTDDHSGGADIDLEIVNSQGGKVANSRLATKPVGGGQALAQGDFWLKTPDVYFLKFSIRDTVANLTIPHEEKIIVSLAP